MYEQFEPANECIYCGVKQSELTREHILAQSLGGSGFVIPKASCKTCQDITSLFERKVADYTYGIYRAFQGGPSKKPLSKLKARLSRTEVLEATDFKGNKVTVKVTVSDIPRVPMYVILSPPLLVDKTRDINIITISCSEKHQKEREREIVKLAAKCKVANISIYSPTIDPRAFQLVLAKTGHCYAYGKLGKLAFKPYLIDFILGADGNIGEFVGGFESAVPQGNKILDLRIEKFGDKELVIVDISMKAVGYLPKYQVVCGELVPH